MTDDMPRKNPIYLRHVKTRHDRWIWEFRRGKQYVRLPDEYGTEQFWQAYNDALAGKQPEKPKEAASGTLAWLVARYKESAAFASLRPSTRRMRDNILKRACENAGTESYLDITREVIDQAIADRSATPHAANNFRKVMSQLFKWAVKQEHVPFNPCEGAARIKVQSDGHHTWTVQEVEQYRTRHATGTMARLAVDLLLFTGLRRSDVILAGKQHVRNGVLTIRTQKTGMTVHIPIFADLRASIDATDTSDLAFLATSYHQPFASASGFGNWFRDRCDEAGLKHCSAHGLRKAGATIAAENGATAYELMAMFGWKRIEEAEIYTKAADRVRLARLAAERIANSQVTHPASGTSLTPENAMKSISKK